ncbi:hypothetical protein [Herbiconiux daphne]|uniref:Uncharacterized protein n=1 Tax=Herbiconiux daphne TaxID=2970914 RepID=A0ABT2H868_9MICO|nr:hypothetical protein [Herbiconiux daphne]MCS5736114.1 hypothetical protein [Herbiconiux daphne]
MYAAIQNIDDVCNILPLSYWAGLGCSANPTLEDAVAQAHYQGKRIRALFYQCKELNSASYYSYEVI